MPTSRGDVGDADGAGCDRGVGGGDGLIVLSQGRNTGFGGCDENDAAMTTTTTTAGVRSDDPPPPPITMIPLRRAWRGAEACHGRDRDR